jgi:hypothetical protein
MLDIVPVAVRKEKERHEQVITILREGLARAQAGEVVALLLVEKNDKGDWSGRYSGLANRYETAGHLEVMKLRVLNCEDEL